MTEPLPCPFCGHVGLSQREGSTFRWLTTECNGCGAQCGEERINTMTMERSAAIEQAKVQAIKTWNTRFTPFPPQQQAEPVCPECKAAVLYECVACSSNNYPPQQQAEPVAWNAGVAPMWPQQKEGETFSVSYTTTPQPEQQADPKYIVQSNGRHSPLLTHMMTKRTTPAQAEPVAMRMPRVGDRVICLEDESLGEVVSLTAGGSPDITFDDGSRGTYMVHEFAELFGYAEQRQQQAEPVACRFCFSEKGCWTWQCYHCGEIDDVQKPAPPQQQAEPVAYFDFQEHKFSWAKNMKIGPVPVSVKVEPMKLYLESPQRQWVGLEAEDLAQIESDEFWQTGNHMAIAVAVEAKLKERNI